MTIFYSGASAYVAHSNFHDAGPSYLTMFLSAPVASLACSRTLSGSLTTFGAIAAGDLFTASKVSETRMPFLITRD